MTGKFHLSFIRIQFEVNPILLRTAVLSWRRAVLVNAVRRSE